ncbi:MAG: tetratricopeptide repeat protein [Candidatus Sericytochromatia bacterium]|nr:tetratricopeptide repeat protein [Candidatus Tanganyikabacteria bacterium]
MAASSDLGIEEIKDALRDGDFEHAKDRLAQLACESVRDGRTHMEIAQLAEDAGDLSRAILEYNHALRDSPQDVDTLRRLANLRADLGQTDRAIRCFKKLLDLAPDDAEARRALQTLERQAGPASEPEPPRGTVPPPAVEPPLPEPSDADAINLVTRFAGREGVYARQWTSPTDRAGYTPVHEPFTPAVARKHLLGDLTLGVYVVRTDDSVNFLAFDLDLARFAMESASKTRTWPTLVRTVQQAAVAYLDRCAALEIPAFIEDSGSKGRHVWVFFDRPVPAAWALRLAHLIRSGMPELPAEVAVEVFPKQAKIKGNGLGNLIKIPLGIHRKTGRRCHFLEPDGTPVADPYRFLADLRPVGYDHVLDLISRPEASPQPANEVPWDDPPGEAKPAEPAQDAAATSIAAVPYDRAQDLEVLWLLRRCPVIGELVRKAETIHALTADERLVLKHTVGHLPNGSEAFNTILGLVQPILAAEFMKKRFQGNPMGCRRIVERVPDVVGRVPCGCRFDRSAMPTPLLHLMDLRAAAPQLQPDGISQLMLERMVGELVRLRVEAARLAALQFRLEEQMRAYLIEKGLSQVSTATGSVTLGPDQDLQVTIPISTPLIEVEAPMTLPEATAESAEATPGE